MPRTNPSQHLTLTRVDQIANLVLKGERYLTKKEKPLWPTPKEAWQVGLGGWSGCLDYLNERDDLSFNSGQRSRRAAKLAEGLERLRTQHRVDNDFVWQVKLGWSSTWGFVCAPSEAAAKQIGHTMFVMGDHKDLLGRMGRGGQAQPGDDHSASEQHSGQQESDRRVPEAD